MRPLEALRQRITVAYHVRPLIAEEMAAYVTHHLQRVAIDRPLFTDKRLAIQRGMVPWAFPAALTPGPPPACRRRMGGQHPSIDDEDVAIAQAERQWDGALT